MLVHHHHRDGAHRCSPHDIRRNEEDVTVERHTHGTKTAATLSHTNEMNDANAGGARHGSCYGRPRRTKHIWWHIILPHFIFFFSCCCRHTFFTYEWQRHFLFSVNLQKQKSWMKRKKTKISYSKALAYSVTEGEQAKITLWASFFLFLCFSRHFLAFLGISSVAYFRKKPRCYENHNNNGIITMRRILYVIIIIYVSISWNEEKERETERKGEGSDGIVIAHDMGLIWNKLMWQY